MNLVPFKTLSRNHQTCQRSRDAVPIWYQIEAVTLLGSAAQVVEKSKIRPAYGHQIAKFDKKARSPLPSTVCT